MDAGSFPRALSELVIDIHGLTRVYGADDAIVYALAGLDLQVRRGEFVAVMGPSGSGKSTLMNIMGCLDRPTDGQYILDGLDVSRLDRTELAIVRNLKIGFVFQSYNLLPRLTAVKNVMLPLLYNSEERLSEPERYERAVTALESVGLGNRLHHRPNQMSGGQQQRVAIARALINKPAMILADEPTGNLDTKSSAEVMDLLHKLHASGATIVMVTHEPDIALQAQRVVCVRDGKVVSDGRAGASHCAWTGEDAMTPVETMQVAWEGLKLNRVRSFLTTLGVIIGVASVIMMLAVSAGAEAAIADQINALGANLIIVNPMRGVPGNSQTLTYDDAVAIEESVRNTDGVSAEFQVVQNVSSSRAKLDSLTVLGVTPGFPGVRDYSIGEGRFFNADENDRKAKVVVLGHGISQDLFGAENAIGQTVTVGSSKLVVLGVMEPKGVVADVDYDGRIYVPLQLLYHKFSPSIMAADRVRTIYVKAESQEAMENVTNQIRALLVERHDVDPAKPDFALQTQQDIINTQQATTEAFRNLLAWVAAVSLVVGGIGIMNIMLVSVTERTREIGLRQALGARPRDVLLQFLIEAVTLSLVGGLVGVLLGVGAAELFGRLGDMETQIVPASVPLAFGAAAAVGIFFGYYPAVKAAQLDPIVALRHE